MKKIALVCTQLNDLGGANNHLKNLYKGLSKKGHKVRLVLCSNVEMDLISYFQKEQVPKKDIFFIPRIKKILFLPFITRLKKIFRSEDFDIIFSFHIQTDIFVALSADRAIKANIFSYYESTVLPENISFVKKMFYKAMNNFIKNIFKKTIVVSMGLKKEIVSSGFRDVSSTEVINIGVDIPAMYLNKDFDFQGLKNQKPLIGTVARLSREKGIDRLVRATPFVLEKLPGARFIIIGSGKEEAFLKDLSDKLNVRGRITFKPWTDNVYEELEKIDIFVMPSLREGCPAALIEALFLKRPVIASDIPGISEILKENYSILINTNNIELFSKSILSLCYNPTQAVRFGENGYKEAIKNFTLDIEIQKLLSLQN